MSIMEYKGFQGSIEFSQEDRLYFGKVLDTPSLISYEGKTLAQLEEDFHQGVDDYLTLLCS
jgi:predicted HicB family RNase H-like nuclease